MVESVKAVSDLFTPIGGEVLEVNGELETDPALVNREPFAGGWLFRVRVGDTAELGNLIAPADYDALVAAG